MTIARKTTGTALAIAAAAFLASAPVATYARSDVGLCMGANACKGQSSCKPASSSCKGLNNCKGQGFVEMTKADCTTAGGKFET